MLVSIIEIQTKLLGSIEQGNVRVCGMAQDSSGGKRVVKKLSKNIYRLAFQQNDSNRVQRKIGDKKQSCASPPSQSNVNVFAACVVRLYLWSKKST